MTNEAILETALEQSAVDAGCRLEDFLREESVVVLSRKDPAAGYISCFPAERCFETPQMRILICGEMNAESL